MKPIARVMWTPLLDTRAVDALAAVLAGWKGTAYQPGAQERGEGVDCVRFVCAALDELRGTKTPIETLPQDAALHDPAQARAAMLRLRRAYGPADRVDLLGDTLMVEPGDVLVTGRAGGGPGHAMIVGAQRNTLWEATAPAVRWTGMSALKQRDPRVAVFCAFRPERKDLWGRARG